MQIWLKQISSFSCDLYQGFSEGPCADLKSRLDHQKTCSKCRGRVEKAPDLSTIIQPNYQARSLPSMPSSPVFESSELFPPNPHEGFSRILLSCLLSTTAQTSVSVGEETQVLHLPDIRPSLLVCPSTFLFLCPFLDFSLAISLERNLRKSSTLRGSWKLMV